MMSIQITTLIILFFMFNAAFQTSEQCSPVSKTDHARLQEGFSFDYPKSSRNSALRNALAAAEDNIVDGRLNFSLDQPKMPLANATGSAICTGPAQPLTLVRARLGQTAVFSCPLDHCVGDNASQPNFDQVLWRYGDHSLWHVFCERSPSPFDCTRNPASTNAYLHIHNLTIDTAGPVCCFCRLKNTTEFCLNQAYELRPILIPSDVFEIPVWNVTRPAGNSVTVLVKLRIRMTENTSHRYIVRFNRRIVWAQTSHPLHALTETMFPNGVHFALNDASLSMIFPYLPKSFSGQFEVWVRPYMELDEFVVQTINLEII